MRRKINDQFNCSRMMLSEHREKLHQHRLRQQLAAENPPPNHDEQQWAEYQLLLDQSLFLGLVISLTFWTREQPITFTGCVTRMEQATGLIYLATPQGTKKLSASQVLKVNQIP